MERERHEDVEPHRPTSCLLLRPRRRREGAPRLLEGRSAASMLRQLLARQVSHASHRRQPLAAWVDAMWLPLCICSVENGARRVCRREDSKVTVSPASRKAIVVSDWPWVLEEEPSRRLRALARRAELRREVDDTLAANLVTYRMSVNLHQPASLSGNNSWALGRHPTQSSC